MTMENESIYEVSSSEFDSIPDVVDSLGPESVAEQDPAEQEQPEQEEQGSVDSSEPDSDPGTESVADVDSVTESEPESVDSSSADIFCTDDSSLIAVVGQLVEKSSDISNKLDDIYTAQTYTLFVGLLVVGVFLAVALGRWIYRISNINF